MLVQFYVSVCISVVTCNFVKRRRNSAKWYLIMKASDFILSLVKMTILSFRELEEQRNSANSRDQVTKSEMQKKGQKSLFSRGYKHGTGEDD